MGKRVNPHAVPEALLHDAEVAQALGALPPAYEFEVHKTIHRLRTTNASFVALQMPEGLLMYGCVLSDIFTRFTPATSVVLLGDVTYGACCVDDLGARALGCDFLVHYGHSCLVPMTCTVLPTLYVFVEIAVDVRHAAACLAETMRGRGLERCHVNLMGTVQFSKAITDAQALLLDPTNTPGVSFSCAIPQAKPLSAGEVLGCTAPKNLFDEEMERGGENQCMLFIADGRFHLEAAM
ncbi:hypothetical protein TeGR_g5517, partial [Tetraparma gracilis]